MLRILIIEFILAGTIGAVCFRLAWAVTKSRWVAWGIVLILAILLSLLTPGSIDVELTHEVGVMSSATHLPSPVLVNLNRFLGWIVGAGLAAVVVTKRKKLGLEDDIRFKDFP
ncbi:MAG: hypothetical protein KGI54_16440 [Pseudomonadota bacterium]|nr:hypothetical protein [Pseudomonadota bacterium]